MSPYERVPHAYICINYDKTKGKFTGERHVSELEKKHTSWKGLLHLLLKRKICTFYHKVFTITRYFTFLSSRMCRSSQYGHAMIFFGQSLSRCFCRNRFWNLAPQSFWQRISRYSQFTFTCSWNQNTQKGGYCPSTSYIELVSFLYIVMNGDIFFFHFCSFVSRGTTPGW